MTTLNISLMLGMLAIAGLFAVGFVTMTPYVAYAEDDEETSTEIENEAKASNEDNDEVKQENEATIAQVANSDNDCTAGAAVVDNDVVGVTGANVAVAANDCDTTTTQAATVNQANVNTDNDVQVASADACQQIAALVGFNVC